MVIFSETILYSPFVPPDWESIVLYWKTSKQNENPGQHQSTAAVIAIRKQNLPLSFNIYTKGQWCSWSFNLNLTSFQDFSKMLFWFCFFTVSIACWFCGILISYSCMCCTNRVTSTGKELTSLFFFSLSQLCVLASFPLFFLCFHPQLQFFTMT